MAVEFIESGALKGLDGVTHGFFTRKGGSSEGIYNSLNCGIGSDDEPHCVAANRNQVAHCLGVGRDRLLSPYQFHSAIAVPVAEPGPADQRPRADALVTSTPGLAIAITTADCTPVLFADALAGVAGAAHAGWRGALSGVLEATIDAMEQLGANRNAIKAAVGPTISQPSYEVGHEFQQTFVANNPQFARFFLSPSSEGRPHFDLPGFVAHRLAEAGVGEIDELELCTYRNESEFFSYRRTTHRGELDYGRQISAILLI